VVVVVVVVVVSGSYVTSRNRPIVILNWPVRVCAVTHSWLRCHNKNAEKNAHALELLLDIHKCLHLCKAASLKGPP